MARLLIAPLLLCLAQRLLFAIACLIPRRDPSRSGALPSVRILVTARNEEADLPNLLRCLECLDYDADRLSFVLVSDGSGDRTAALMRAWCQSRERATALVLKRSVGKAAALQAAWQHAPEAELTAVYDADVRPAPGALRLLARKFADPRIGAASGAVVPLNPRENRVSRYAALELWVFHQVIQRARDRLGLNPPAIGAQSVFRTAALQQIGGFTRCGISEDIETSFALIRHGWRTAFDPDAVVATAVPATLPEFWRQRQRWTRGLYQALSQARGLNTALVAAGYLDRLVFVAVLGAALLGKAPWWWPALYFAGPALNVVLALRHARVTSKPAFLFGCLPMFAVDLGVSLTGALASLHKSRRADPAW